MLKLNVITDYFKVIKKMNISNVFIYTDSDDVENYLRFLLSSYQHEVLCKSETYFSKLIYYNGVKVLWLFFRISDFVYFLSRVCGLKVPCSKCHFHCLSLNVTE